MNGGRYDAEAAIAKTEPDACGSAQTERIASNAVAAGLPRGRSPVGAWPNLVNRISNERRFGDNIGIIEAIHSRTNEAVPFIEP